MRTIIKLVRHGQTNGNVAGVYIGKTEEGVNECGRRQAELTAIKLASSKIHAVYTGPLSRCIQTAKAIGGRLLVTISILEGLNELEFGAWEGLSRAQIARRFPSEWAIWRETPHLLRFEGAETLDDGMRRVVSTLSCIAKCHGGETIVVVTHDALIRLAVLDCLGLGPSSYRKVVVGNCSLTTLEFAGANAVRVLSLNETTHLESLI